MRSASCQQIRGMLACAAEEKCIHPVGKGETRRPTAVERERVLLANRETPAREARPLPNDRAGLEQARGRGADSQATGIWRCRAGGSAAWLPPPSGSALGHSACFLHPRGGNPGPHSFSPRPLSRAAPPSILCCSHSSHFWGALVTWGHISAYPPDTRDNS